MGRLRLLLERFSDVSQHTLPLRNSHSAAVRHIGQSLWAPTANCSSHFCLSEEVARLSNRDSPECEGELGSVSFKSMANIRANSGILFFL